MILLKKRIKKALISLRGCAGWYAPVLYANSLRQVFLGCSTFYTYHIVVQLKRFTCTINIPSATPVRTFVCICNLLEFASFAALSAFNPDSWAYSNILIIKKQFPISWNNHAVSCGLVHSGAFLLYL